jgi:hypothetical protein
MHIMQKMQYVIQNNEILHIPVLFSVAIVEELELI